MLRGPQDPCSKEVDDQEIKVEDERHRQYKGQRLELKMAAGYLALGYSTADILLVLYYLHLVCTYSKKVVKAGGVHTNNVLKSILHNMSPEDSLFSKIMFYSLKREKFLIRVEISGDSSD